MVRTAPGRGHKSQKAYIALFIYMPTKAIHIELVSDYSTSAFIAAFQRFVARRGMPKSMYSDNGTTFQGADKELTESYYTAILNADFRNQLITDKISWNFIPSSAPHFGGLWEAGVKSIKYHLLRSIGSHRLTFEEMTTLLCRIEACLNSRPLSAISDCYDDYQPLTPSHFLTGSALTALPEPSILNLSENRLSRWQLLQHVAENLWKSWKNDYLHTL